MEITRTPAKDFAVSRFAVDIEFFLSNAFDGFAKGDSGKLQALYDARAEAQRNEDGYDDWSAYLASGLPTLAAQPAPDPIIPPARPRTIAGAYFRAALTDLGHMATVRAALTDPIDLELFNTASEFNDSTADVNSVAAALSIDLSAVFDRAEAIRAARQS
jgi:hypothetical protein